MIGEVLVLLRDLLNSYISVKSGWVPGDPAEGKVVLLDGEKTDPIGFKLGAVTCLLVNIEQENTLRPADPYRRTLADGAILRVQPEIRLNLYVLFVASFKQYEQGLDYLSLIIHYFQAHRVLDHQNAPNLSDRIDSLILELVTLPTSEQNEIWSSLRTAYRPSVMYRVRMVVLGDEDSLPVSEVEEKTFRVTQ